MPRWLCYRNVLADQHFLETVFKNKKSKKKKSGKGKLNGELAKPNGIKVENEPENDDAEEEDQIPRTPTEPSSSPSKEDVQYNHSATNGASRRAEDVHLISGEPDQEGHRNANANLSDSRDASGAHDTTSDALETNSLVETDARFKALVEERSLLREEVAQVRKTLEEIQRNHGMELGTIREQLAESRGEKEQAEAQYKGLLGKVSTIRSQLGERLKADAVGLST